MNLLHGNFLFELSLEAILTSEGVESEVEEGEILELEDIAGEAAGQMVVADVELVEVGKLVKVSGDGASELVGIGMEEGNVWQLFYEALDRRGFQMEAIEVDRSEGEGGLVVGWAVAVEALVTAYVFAPPCFYNPFWVIFYGPLETLDYGVDRFKSYVCKIRFWWWWRRRRWGRWWRWWWWGWWWWRRRWGRWGWWWWRWWWWWWRRWGWWGRRRRRADRFWGRRRAGRLFRRRRRKKRANATDTEAKVITTTNSSSTYSNF